MSADEHDRMVELVALVKAANASRRIAKVCTDDDYGVYEEQYPAYYLIPRGIWDELVKTAEGKE